MKESEANSVHAVKACREVKLYLCSLLSLALYGGESSASRSDGFTPGESDCQSPSIRRLSEISSRSAHLEE